MMDVEDEKNGVIKTCVGYTGAVRVMVIDEMADVNERVWFICSIVIDDNLTNVIVVDFLLIFFQHYTCFHTISPHDARQDKQNTIHCTWIMISQDYKHRIYD